VLGLPYAFKYLQWPGGMVTIILSYIISLYTLWQLCVLHEDRGKRFNRRVPPQATPAPPLAAPAASAGHGGREGGCCWHLVAPRLQTGLLDNNEEQAVSDRRAAQAPASPTGLGVGVSWQAASDAATKWALCSWQFNRLGARAAPRAQRPRPAGTTSLAATHSGSGAAGGSSPSRSWWLWSA